MIKGMKKWLDKQRNVIQKKAGLAEKEASIQRKLDVAMAILQDNRKEDLPVKHDRRLNVRPA